ncbi:MAG: AbrB/MazE/SpoVT family DNA-binding domain-containing protein [Candidatus Nezhaarchaeales archaeon]
MGESVEQRVFVAKVSRKNLVAIPKPVTDKLNICEGMRVRFVIRGDEVILEPEKDAFWYALHGPKIGRISFNELEEESEREQEALQGSP